MPTKARRKFSREIFPPASGWCFRNDHPGSFSTTARGPNGGHASKLQRLAAEAKIEVPIASSAPESERTGESNPGVDYEKIVFRRAHTNGNAGERAESA